MTSFGHEPHGIDLFFVTCRSGKESCWGVPPPRRRRWGQRGIWASSLETWMLLPGSLEDPPSLPGGPPCPAVPADWTKVLPEPEGRGAEGKMQWSNIKDIYKESLLRMATIWNSHVIMWKFISYVIMWNTPLVSESWSFYLWVQV